MFEMNQESELRLSHHPSRWSFWTTSYLRIIHVTEQPHDPELAEDFIISCPKFTTTTTHQHHSFQQQQQYSTVHCEAD